MIITRRIGILVTAAFLALGSSAHANSINLVQNGDFETGDLTSWTLSGDPAWNFVGLRSGSQVMQFGSSDLSSLTQTLITTPGTIYTFNFDLAVEAGTNADPTATFNVYWNNTNLPIDISTEGWLTGHSYTVTATTAATDIEFVAANPLSFYSIDNVTVTEAVPEPATWAMALSGLGVFAVFRRMQRKTSV